MPRPFLIIDGYNLMHAAGFARRRYGPKGFERSRTQLVKYLVEHLTEDELSRARLVFDGQEGPYDRQRTETIDGLTVQFSPRRVDADTVIEEIVASHSAPRQLRVVSSDHRLQKAAHRRRGKFVDSEDFVDELRTRAAAEAAAGPISNELLAKSGDESVEICTDEWLEHFGPIDTGGTESNSTTRKDNRGGVADIEDFDAQMTESIRQDPELGNDPGVAT